MFIQRKSLIYSAVCGLLLTAAFPKWGLGFLAWLALVPFGLAARTLKPGESFRFGFAAGLVHYLSLLYWLVPTMRIYGHLPALLAVVILFSFCCFLALFFGAVGWSFSRLGRTPLLAALWFPVIWVAAEYTRTFLFSGFPWALLGHSQYERLALIQLADLAGVYGLSFIIAGVNFGVVLLVAAACRLRWHGSVVSRRLAAGAGAVLILVTGAVILYGQTRLQQIDRSQATADTMKVAAIQGNIDQALKWDDAFKAETIETYNRLSAGIADQRPDLVVWPETAAPFYFMVEEAPTLRILSAIRGGTSSFLIGSPSVLKRADDYEFYNSAWLIDPNGKPQGKYDKAHLVPFGEYTPFKKWLPFLGKIVEQVGDFVPGPKGRVIGWNGHKLGVQICYEIIFPDLARAQVRNGADLLVNITNDAWYGRTSGPYQHFSMVAFRAVENRRALVRAANTGISGFVDPAGRITRSTGLYEEAAVVQKLPLLKTRTVYTRCGDLFAKACLFTTVAGIISAWLLPKIRARRQ